MRKNVKEFIKICSESLIIHEPIYEFGSLQVDNQNSDLRPFFEDKKYIGVDFRNGKGVDLVADMTNLSQIENNSVGTIICCDTLEHVNNPFATIKEFKRILKKEGVLIITTPFYFKIHSYPNDYYRFTDMGMFELLKDFIHARVIKIGNTKKPHTILTMASNDCSSFSSCIYLELDDYIKRWRKELLFSDYILTLYVRIKRKIFGKNFKILR
jgi:SAM-dependent methyltransferase